MAKAKAEVCWRASLLLLKSGAADGKFCGNQDGKVTVAELKKFLGEEVTYKARRTYGRDQYPQVTGNNKIFR